MKIYSVNDNLHDLASSERYRHKIVHVILNEVKPRHAVSLA